MKEGKPGWRRNCAGARMLAVVVGSWKAIAIAVRNEGAGQRHTRLRERLQSEEILDLLVE